MTYLSLHHQVARADGVGCLPPVQEGCCPGRMIQFKDLIQAIYTVPAQALPIA